MLGESYEAARLKLKNPDGPPPKSAKGKKASSKPKSAGKRKKNDDDEDEEKPSKKARRTKDEDEDEDDALDGGKFEVLLANKWDLDGPDPTDWWISEKLDGVRYDNVFNQQRPLMFPVPITTARHLSVV